LTPTEEAQTRQLLDQLAALLSLATSEPTIISKLAATKVSLSDLSSVVTVNDTDLLLSRQGTDDKSVTVEKLKDFVKDSVSTVAFNDGTAVSPSITNDGDLDTGFYFPAANVVAATTAGVESVRFTATGIGRNVVTPSSSIDLADVVSAAGGNGFKFADISDTTRNIELARTGISYSYKGVSGAVGLLYSSNSLALLADTTGGNNSILFSVGGAIRAQLQWDGKFGIGTTSPATTLDVNGDVTITDKIIHSGDTDTSIRFPAVDTVTVETGGVERMRVTSGGNVGIGTVAPLNALQVKVATDRNIGILTSFSGASVGLSAYNDAGTANVPLSLQGDDVRIVAGGSERIRVSSAGGVGIGTTPSEQLHITGNFRIGSAVQATPSGSAPLYAARAWVNFNGTGTVAIRASGNVTSITDNNTGDYTVNYTTAMPDANYGFSISSIDADAAGDSIVGGKNQTTTSIRIAHRNGTNTPEDPTAMCVAIFR
jgi:hypothetical protein